jgi:hypothetical protein
MPWPVRPSDYDPEGIIAKTVEQVLGGDSDRLADACRMSWSQTGGSFPDPSKGFSNNINYVDMLRMEQDYQSSLRHPPSSIMGADCGQADEAAFKADRVSAVSTAWPNVPPVDASWRTSPPEVPAARADGLRRVARDEPSYVLRDGLSSLGGSATGTTMATMGPAAWEKASGDFASATLQDWLMPLRARPDGMNKDKALTTPIQPMYSPFNDTLDDKLSNQIRGPPGLVDNEVMSMSAGNGEEPVTTVMLRNIACRYSQEDIATALDDIGLAWTYELVYIPRSPTRKSNLGYAFVYFRDPKYVADCIRLCDGKPFGRCSTTKLCKVALAHVQGEQGLLPKPGKKKNSRKHGQAPLFCL